MQLLWLERAPFCRQRNGIREAVQSGQSHTAYKPRTRAGTQHCLMLHFGFMSLPHTGPHKGPFPKRKKKRGPHPWILCLTAGPLKHPQIERGQRPSLPPKLKPFVPGGGIWATEHAGRGAHAQTHLCTHALARLGEALRDSCDRFQNKDFQPDHGFVWCSAQATG